MEEVYIIESLRSPIGKFMGGMNELSAVELGAQVVRELSSRIGKEVRIDGLISGNVLSAGIGQNPAKQVVMGAGLQSNIPTLNVNMVCASGLRAIEIAANMIRTGDAEVVIAGGMESMSNSPRIIGGTRQFGRMGDMELVELCKHSSESGDRYRLVDEMVLDGLWDCYSEVHMGELAGRISKRYNISRKEQDRFALRSHQRAEAARQNGYFKEEIVGIRRRDGETISEDEGIRSDTSIEKLGALKPAFRSSTVTAGNSSQLSDGAAFAIVASKSKVEEMGIRPIGKIEAYADSGIDPEWYGLAPIDSVRIVLKKAGVGLESVDLVEINEAFAVQTLAVMKELDIDESKLNPNGGAIALGHPLGASGARILTTLLHSMRRMGKDRGIATLCHGGGGSASMIVSRVDQ
jgi:acetyl-CoA acetyltransferases